MLQLSLIFLAAYLCGSIPSGVWLARAFGLGDPRQFGSGNTGAANLTRLGGKKLGISTFLCDFLKGLLPTLAVMLLLPDEPTLPAVVGSLCIIGHCYSVFLSFRGGKGVATSAGVFAVLSPPTLGIALLFWLVIFLLERTASLAGLVAVMVLFLVNLSTHESLGVICATAICTLIVIRKHGTNLVALLSENERRF